MAADVSFAVASRRTVDRGRQTIRRAHQILASAGVILLLAIGWLTFGPVGFGGSASYVVTEGTSMLPTVHGGGLVITRSKSTYQVGDVVAYHNHQLNSVVLHRIVGLDGEHFLFKGDNNNFVDAYQPTKADLIGKKWIYWPAGGRLLVNLRTPWVGALVLGGFGMWAFAGGDKARSPHRRKHRHVR